MDYYSCYSYSDATVVVGPVLRPVVVAAVGLEVLERHMS